MPSLYKPRAHLEDILENASDALIVVQEMFFADSDLYDLAAVRDALKMIREDARKALGKS